MTWTAEQLSSTVNSPNKRRVISHHIRALDGLRALAIFAVIFHHCGEYYLISRSSGSLIRYVIANLGSGVDLFFVLSGFLITGILLDSKGKSNFFIRFYWRRGLRIWPLYYMFLLVTYLTHKKIFSGIGVTPFALYYRNFLGPDFISDIYIGQFWSLCVEEQFYLLWPVILYFLPERFRISLVIFLIAAAFWIRIVLLHLGKSSYVVLRLPFCHMDVLLAGALIAILIKGGMSLRTLKRYCWGSLLLLLVGMVMDAIVHIGVVPNLAISLRLTILSVFYGAVLGACIAVDAGKGATFLKGTFFRSISTRSYGMYVFHLIPLRLSVAFLRRFGVNGVQTSYALTLIFMICAITYGMAWVSWKFFEEPLLRMKRWEWFEKK